MEHKNDFNYTYSAADRQEILSIREKYAAKEEDKMARLRRLDIRVTQRAEVVALVLGILGALILGLGMSLILTDLGAGLGAVGALVFGCILGLAGGTMAAFALPAYHLVLARERKKIAPEILRLTDELMK